MISDFVTHRQTNKLQKKRKKRKIYYFPDCVRDQLLQTLSNFLLLVLRSAFTPTSHYYFVDKDKNTFLDKDKENTPEQV